MRSIRKAIPAKDLILDSSIRPTGRQDIFEGKLQTELFRQSQFHGLLPGSARTEHRAIDIKEQNVTCHSASAHQYDQNAKLRQPIE